ncbi:MAG: trimeric intracellular cation channel family protein [Phormidesmis sp.]
MQQFIELLAVVSSAIYGVLLARKYNMDLVGVFSLAFILAFGGGTLRDVFLDRHPLFWIRENHYAVIVFFIAIAAFFIPRYPKKTEQYLNLPDALGLGLFSVTGADAAIDAGTSWFIASMLGAVTGTFGGVMGDVICNRIPSLFRPSTPFFATCSFVGSWVFIVLNSVPALQPSAALLSILFIVLFRLAAIRYHWTLPSLKDDTYDELADELPHQLLDESSGDGGV